MSDHEDEKSILKYVGIFGVAYFILRLIFSILLSLIHAEHYKTIIVMGTSAALAALNFFKITTVHSSNEKKQESYLDLSYAY